MTKEIHKYSVENREFIITREDGTKNHFNKAELKQFIKDLKEVLPFID